MKQYLIKLLVDSGNFCKEIRITNKIRNSQKQIVKNAIAKLVLLSHSALKMYV